MRELQIIMVRHLTVIYLTKDMHRPKYIFWSTQITLNWKVINCKVVDHTESSIFMPKLSSTELIWKICVFSLKKARMDWFRTSNKWNSYFCLNFNLEEQKIANFVHWMCKQKYIIFIFQKIKNICIYICFFKGLSVIFLFLGT